MTSIPSQTNAPNECRRLQQQVERDGGTHNLSQTDLAFFQTFCETDHDALPHQKATGLNGDNAIDEKRPYPGRHNIR